VNPDVVVLPIKMNGGFGRTKAILDKRSTGNESMKTMTGSIPRISIEEILYS